MKPDGLTMRSSHFGPRETMDRLAAAVEARGMTVHARIDHAAGAAAIGMALPPTELLLFGSARVDTSLMQSTRTVGIDLPLHALVWQDEAGDTCLTYGDPQWLGRRHGLGAESDAMLEGLGSELAALVREVTKGPAGPR